jgi:hypothetical protein
MPVTKTTSEIKAEVVAYLTGNYTTPEYIRLLLSKTEEEDGYYMSLEEIEKQVSFYTRWLKTILQDSKLGRAACVYFYKGCTSKKLTIVHNQQLYEDTDTFDLFRIGGYPDTVLTSYKQTVEYCKQFNIGEDKLESTYQFFKDHPDGLIQFG